MKDLFLSECRRFRNAALIAAAVHCVIQLLASRLLEPLQMHWQQALPYPLLCAVTGLAFAMVQFGSYRQPSRWVWLMHRPLPRGRIFCALSLAALTLIVLAIGLPILLALLGTDFLTGRTVDARHYLIPLHMVLASFIAWLAGTYLMLCGRRMAWVVLLVPGVLMGHLAAGAALLVPALLCTAMMAALALTAFAPDRKAPPTTPAGLLAAAIPLQLGFYLLMLWGGSLLFQSGQMLLGVHPLSRTVPLAGSATELARMDGRSAILRGLLESQDPRAAHWRRQVALTEVGSVHPAGRDHPVRHQITNLAQTKWTDERRGIIWTFNHERMLYEGRDIVTDAPRGWYGMGGMDDQRPFASVPVMPPWAILTRQHLLLPDPDSGKAYPLVTVGGTETLTGPVMKVGMQQFAVTNQRFIAFRQPATARAPLEALYSIALPGPFSDLNRVHVARLLDGTLLSFNFGRLMAPGYSDSRQHLLFVDAQGRASTVAERVLVRDFPPLFEYRDWWLSPLSHALVSLPDRLLDKGVIDNAPGTAEPSPPATVVAAALLATLLSAALAWWRLRAGPAKSRLAWSAAALLLGPPCLAVLWTLRPRAAAAAAPALALLPATA